MLLVWLAGGSKSCCTWLNWIAEGMVSRAIRRDIGGIRHTMVAGDCKRWMDGWGGALTVFPYSLYFLVLCTKLYVRNVVIVVLEGEGGYTGL